MGGTSDPNANQPTNLVLLCKPCHRCVESHRPAARAAGWLVRQGRDPAAVVVQLPAGPVLLTDDGRYFAAD
jgi:hypothetical protein